MQSIDQQAAYIYIQAAASQTSGQPLSRNSRIQTPNSCLSDTVNQTELSRLAINSRPIERPGHQDVIPPSAPDPG